MAILRSPAAFYEKELGEKIGIKKHKISLVFFSLRGCVGLGTNTPYPSH